MKILYLPLNKEPYDMIECGEKPEEYREIVNYWVVRLLVCAKTCGRRCDKDRSHACLFGPVFKHFDAVCFSYGYTKRRMMFECKGITIGQGRSEWGAPDHETFIIKLGERIQ